MRVHICIVNSLAKIEWQ